MMTMGMTKTVTTDFEKRMRRKRMMNDLEDMFCPLLTIFKRLFLLVKYAIFKVICLLTIPFFIIGGFGAYNFFRMIDDAVSNNIFFADSIYFKQAISLLGIYAIYHFVKMGLDCNLHKK